MLNFNRTKLQTLMASLLIALALSACNGEVAAPDDSVGVTDSVYPATVFVSFKAGPNAGRHQYTVDGSQDSKIELKYNAQNDVTFLEFHGLVSLDGRLRIDELRRFTKGQLTLGSNPASTWQAKPSDENKQCGALNLRDHENSQDFENAYGAFSQCGDTLIDGLSGWQNADDSLTKNRITKGQFSDRLRFEMSMDQGPFQRFETEVMVEFNLLETAARP